MEQIMENQFSARQKELYQRIDEVVHYIWDPIGINGAPEARDEYYSYLPEISRIVEDSNDENQIEKYLKKVQTESMGLVESKELNREVAGIITNWNEYLKEKYRA